MNYIIFFCFALIISSCWYYYLHHKTKISKKYLFIDNIIVALLSGLIDIFIFRQSFILVYIFIPFLVLGFSFALTMIRFWRTPKRKPSGNINDIISSADGNVIYCKKVLEGHIPVSIKNGLEASLTELTGTDILKSSFWIIGINMTPFDVHKNCAPITGEIILNKHINGEFLSLKHPEASIRNERNTLVIKNSDNEFFGIIQTASKRVRRIDSYVKEGQIINKGDWFGMIRFGSQVDMIIPEKFKPIVEIGQQIYAAKTIVAKKIE